MSAWRRPFRRWSLGVILEETCDGGIRGGAQTRCGFSTRKWAPRSLHACFNVAIASAGLRAEQALQRWEYILVLGLSAATIWAGVALLITLTGGRLGREDTPSRRRTDEPARPAGRELAHA